MAMTPTIGGPQKPPTPSPRQTARERPQDDMLREPINNTCLGKIKGTLTSPGGDWVYWEGVEPLARVPPAVQKRVSAGQKKTRQDGQIAFWALASS